MKKATEAARLITAILLGLSAGISLVRNVRELVQAEADALTSERERP